MSTPTQDSYKLWLLAPLTTASLQSSGKRHRRRKRVCVPRLSGRSLSKPMTAIQTKRTAWMHGSCRPWGLDLQHRSLAHQPEVLQQATSRDGPTMHQLSTFLLEAATTRLSHLPHLLLGLQAEHHLMLPKVRSRATMDQATIEVTTGEAAEVEVTDEATVVVAVGHKIEERRGTE